MRRFAVALTSFAIGCGGSVAGSAPEVGVDASDAFVADGYVVDTFVPGFDVGASDVTIEFENFNFTFCRCHHGTGPGVDGTATMRIENAGTRAAKIELKTFRLLSVVDAPQYDIDPGGWVKMKTPAGLFDSITVPGGTTTTATLTVYIDSRDVEPPALNYHLELGYLDEGVARVVGSGSFRIKTE